jgi:hypothetical protein
MIWFLSVFSVKQAFSLLDSIDDLTSGALHQFLFCIFDVFYLFCIFCILCILCVCCVFHRTNTKSVSSDDWDVKRQEIAAEHKLSQAQQDLKNGWKAWIKENCPNKSGRASTENRPVNGLKSIDRKRAAGAELLPRLPHSHCTMTINSLKTHNFNNLEKEYSKKYAEYAQKYAEYAKQYPEHAKKYAEYAE